MADRSRPQLLILSSDPLYERLAGPGIRVVEMARLLARVCNVTVAAPERADVSLPDVDCFSYVPGDQAAVRRLAENADCLLLQGYTLSSYPVLARLDKILIIDLYDPFNLENLIAHSKLPSKQARALAAEDTRVLRDQLLAGDFFICAGERQRRLWLGALAMLGRLSPIAQTDPTFRSLIDVVPFGLPPSMPSHTRNVLKGVVPGINLGDIVALWGGGVWDWLDPLTVIRAMALVREHNPRLKLFFLGFHHPHPASVPVMPIYERAVALAEELGLRGRSVFFNDRWVPYHERENYLVEADIGVSAHLDHIETRFAFRTRMLDYIWAGLPMVVTGGDALGDMAEVRGLGRTVGIGDEQGFAHALLEIAGTPGGREAFASSFQQVRDELAWPAVIQPLLRFCSKPTKAPRPAAHAQNEAVEQLDVRARIGNLEEAIETRNGRIQQLEKEIRRIEAQPLMRLLRRADILRNALRPAGRKG